MSYGCLIDIIIYIVIIVFVIIGIIIGTTNIFFGGLTILFLLIGICSVSSMKVNYVRYARARRLTRYSCCFRYTRM